MMKRSIKKTLPFVLPLASVAFLASCASKPAGYTALPPGSDISVQMAQTEALLVAGRSANLGLLAPESFKKAEQALQEAKEDRADKQKSEETLSDISLAQAYLRLAENTAKVSQPALAPVLEAREDAVNAEAGRVLKTKLVKLDEDFKDISTEIETRGELKDARQDGPKLAKKYAELPTEALEKGGRPVQQRVLMNENSNLRAQNAATSEMLQQNAQQMQILAENIADKNMQEAKLNAIRLRFTPDEADVLVNRKNEIVIQLKGLQFPSNRADIAPKALPLLSKLQQALKEFPTAKIVVEGHTDSLGSKEANQVLSKKRAEAVSGYLVQSQADAAREIEAIGKGRGEPIATNKTAFGRAQNRRIDVVVERNQAL